MKSIISKQLFSCRLLLLTMFLLSVTTLSARNIIDDAFSQISFSKKDFADTIKVKVLDGAVIVPVEIDGRTRHFIFDTGSQSGNWIGAKESWMTPFGSEKINVADSNNQEFEQSLYQCTPIRLGNLRIFNYPMVLGEGSVDYVFNQFDGALGFDLVAKGLSFKLNTKDSLLIVTDRKGFFDKEEKGKHFVKYTLVDKTKPAVKVILPICPMVTLFDTGAINIWIHWPQHILQRFLDKYPKKRKEVDALTIQTDTTINTTFGLHGLSNDTLEDRLLHFPSVSVGSLTINDIYVTTANHSLSMGTALMKHASLIIDSNKKRFVFLPHNGQHGITIGNSEIGSLSFIPSEAVDTLGVLKALVRKGSTVYQKGIRNGDYLIEFDGKPITDICSYLFTEHKGKDTPMKFLSPDGTIKEVIINY